MAREVFILCSSGAFSIGVCAGIVCASVPMILTSRRVMCNGVFEQRQELMAVVWTLFDAPDASHADIARIIGSRSSPIPLPTCFAP